MRRGSILTCFRSFQFLEVGLSVTGAVAAAAGAAAAAEGSAAAGVGVGLGVGAGSGVGNSCVFAAVEGSAAASGLGSPSLGRPSAAGAGPCSAGWPDDPEDMPLSKASNSASLASPPRSPENVDLWTPKGGEEVKGAEGGADLWVGRGGEEVCGRSLGSMGGTFEFSLEGDDEGGKEGEGEA